MKIGGWSDIRTFEIYIRLSGIDVEGATECLTYGIENDLASEQGELSEVKKAIEETYR